MFKPINNEKKYMLIVKQIKKLIEEGKLKAGDRLPPERELANKFKLSRATVREAFTALEIIGIIEIKAGSGTFITNSINQTLEKELEDELNSKTSPTELFEARMIIEPEQVRLATQNATKDDLLELEKLIEKANNLDNDEIEEFEKIDKEFHLMIAKATNNEVIFNFSKSINSQRMGIIWGNLKRKSLQKKGRIERYKKEHTELFKAIKERNAQLAKELITKHLRSIEQDLFEE